MSGEETNSNGGGDTAISTESTAVVSPPASTTFTTGTMQNVLQNALFDLYCRSEVEAALGDLVTDVELAVNLQEQLRSTIHQNEAERIIGEQELALEETNVVQKDRLKSQTLLADALVKDLWTLSTEVGSLLELKQKYEAMALEYDEMVAKLAQAEEDLHAARTQKANPSQQQQQPKEQQPSPEITRPSTATAATLQLPPSSASSKTSGTIVSLPPADTTNAASLESTKTDISQQQYPPPAASYTQEATKSQETPALTGEEIGSTKESVAKVSAADASSSASKNEANAKGTPTDNAPVVALVGTDHDAGEESAVNLENIDMDILMRIFGFLDAYDILNTAQVNISMYSRVDSLFGFGMDAPQDDNSTIATTPTVATATQQTPTATTASLSTNNTSTAPSPVPTKLPPLPASAPGPAPSSTKQSETQFGHRLGLGGGRGLLNILAGAAAKSTKPQQSSTKSSASPGRGSSYTSDGGSGKPPLSEAMAHSMAAKLNDAEINAIISMTEKLRSKEKQVSLLTQEKEELEGKLSGSEAVKEFLITKVRDMEKVMNKSDETEQKVTQQIASDQEVIAFLDGRVQELEQLTRLMQKERNAAQEKLRNAMAQNDKKVAVLSDMLQFERQKLKESEREWKATKKLLVKEVKGCRAQIVALQAERDGFREQNDALRKAVMANGSGGATANGRSASPHR